MKDESDRKILNKLVEALRPQMYCYITDEGHVSKKAKDTKQCNQKGNKI